MKHLSLVLLIVFASNLQVLSQPAGTLQFSSHAYDLEDRWVTFPKNASSGKYPFGYIYLDMVSGLTFNLEGTFSFDSQGGVYRDSSDYLKNQMNKLRITPTTPMVALLNDDLLPGLKVNPTPIWLAAYKSGTADRNSVPVKVRIGNHLNAAGGSKKALEYLESAYATEPHAAGLEFELSYAYNHLGQYGRSINILSKAVAYAPNNTAFYKELGFAYLQNKETDSAIKTFVTGISVSEKQKNLTDLDELAYNLSYIYHQAKQYDQAIGVLKNAITALPGKLRLYIQMAVVYTAANDPDNSIKAYAQAIDLVPVSQAEERAQLAWSIALLYRNQKNDLEHYNEWGRKAKEWAPANSKGGQFLKNMNF